MCKRIMSWTFQYLCSQVVPTCHHSTALSAALVRKMSCSPRSRNLEMLPDYISPSSQTLGMKKMQTHANTTKIVGICLSTVKEIVFRSAGSDVLLFACVQDKFCRARQGKREPSRDEQYEKPNNKPTTWAGF